MVVALAEQKRNRRASLRMSLKWSIVTMATYCAVCIGTHKILAAALHRTPHAGSFHNC